MPTTQTTVQLTGEEIGQAIRKHFGFPDKALVNIVADQQGQKMKVTAQVLISENPEK